MSVLRRRIEQPAVVALGSNLGDRETTLRSAIVDLAETDGIELVAASSFHETVALRPEGADPDAPAYLNAVVLLRTTLPPSRLLDVLLRIEHRHGRVRAERWGDRTLDLDLIEFGGLRRHTTRLTLPHPRAHEREFVLAPWLEVDPEAQLTGRGRVADLLARLRGEAT